MLTNSLIHLSAQSEWLLLIVIVLLVIADDDWTCPGPSVHYKNDACCVTRRDKGLIVLQIFIYICHMKVSPRHITFLPTQPLHLKCSLFFPLMLCKCLMQCKGALPEWLVRAHV